MKNIKKIFLQSSFLRVFNLIKKNPNICLYTIILDLLFLFIIITVGKYLGSLIPQDPQQLMTIFKTSTNLLLFVLIYPILFYLFIIFIYSIAKLSILNLIKQLYEKRKFNLKELGKFYLLNILLFIIFFLASTILLAILALILRKDFLTYLIIILTMPFLFFTYSIINIAHTLFIKNKKTKIIRNSFTITFNKITKYGTFIIWNIVLILIYLIFYNIIHLIFRFTIFLNSGILTTYGPAYLKLFNIISIISIYLIIAFNRIYFYERIDKNVLS